MRSADRAIARHALADALAPALLGLVGCAVAIEVAPAHSTWPLAPLAAAALWAGVGLFGEAGGSLAHTLARPVHRGRWLAIRALVHLAALTGAGLIVVFPATGYWAWDAGPPFAFIASLTPLAFGVGALAGAITDNETGATGAGVVGLAAAAGPVYLLVEFYGLSWPRVESALGGWMWPTVLCLSATMAWPVWHLARRLPARQPRRIGATVAAIGALHVLAFVAIWIPTVSSAASAEHGELIALDGVTGGPGIVYTGTRGKIDGVVVERDGQSIPVFGQGPRRATVLEARLSNDGRALALLTLPPAGQGRAVTLLDLVSGERIDTEVEADMTLGHWDPDARRFAFVRSGAQSRLAVGDLSLATVEDRGELATGGKPEILAWIDQGIVVLDSEGEEHTLRVIASDGSKARRELHIQSPAAPVVSRRAVAWLVKEEATRVTDPIRQAWALAMRRWDLEATTVSVDLGLRATPTITGLGFADDDHAFVELSAGPVAVDYRSDAPSVGRRLFIVHHEGVVVTSVVQRNGHRLHSLRGPPSGPWLTADVYGELRRLRPDSSSRVLGRARNMGNRAHSWIPMRTADSDLEFVDHHERVAVPFTTRTDSP